MSAPTLLRALDTRDVALAGSGWFALGCMHMLEPGTPLRALAVFGFVLICPGLAVTGALGFGAPLERAALAIALSMAAALLVGVTFTVLRVDSAALRIATLAVLTSVAVIGPAATGTDERSRP